MLRRIVFSRILIWLVLGCITLEACARIEDAVLYGAPFWENYNNDSIYIYGTHEKRGKPYASYLKWKLNEAGYRGPALRKGAYRIVCLGSSETFGSYESEGGEWPRRLERELNGAAAGRPFEVVNAAYPGMAIAHNLQQIQELAALHPRLVLVYPSYAPYIEPEALNPKPTPTKRWELRIRSRFHTLLKRSLPTSLQNTLRSLEIRLAELHLATEGRVPETAISRFESDLNTLVRELRRRGVEVVLITHATRFGDVAQPEDRPFLTGWRTFYPELAEDGFLDMEKRMRWVTLRVSANYSVPVIDAAARLEPGGANFADFSHFTDRGAQVFASLVAHDLRLFLRAAAVPMVVNFETDCGSECITTSPPNVYHSCPRGTCTATVPGLEQGVTNPVWILPARDNDVLIQLPFSVGSGGTTTVSENPIFGISTQTNNGLGSAAVFETDANAYFIYGVQRADK